jgi:cupin fold WbuC family metalloprotein
MIKITEQRIRVLAGEAEGMPRKRAHLFFPVGPGEGLQPFLFAAGPAAYVRPHRHAGTGGLELMAVLEGEFLAVTFDEAGAVAEHAVLGRTREHRIVAIPAGAWHTVLALRAGSVALIVKQGPYRPETDKTFADWAPEEGTAAARTFLGRIVEALRPGDPPGHPRAGG